MNNKSFDSNRIALGYANRPWLHKDVMRKIQNDCDINVLDNGLDVGCGAGLSTKALRLICNKVTGVDISPEMIKMCNKIYTDESYKFYVSKAEEARAIGELYDIITAAGVINWVDASKFLLNAKNILNENGLIVIYDFGITDKMIGDEYFTEWYNKEYLNLFPKPYRNERQWNQDDLIDIFTMEKQIKYLLYYDFCVDEFIDFMMIQSNVNEAIQSGKISVKEAKDWMRKSLNEIFMNENRTLVFEGYNWYIRKKGS